MVGQTTTDSCRTNNPWAVGETRYGFTASTVFLFPLGYYSYTLNNMLSSKMKRFFTDIAKLQEAIRNRKLVIFAGAGISADAGVPLWGNLIKQLSDEIDIPEQEEDYLRIAQMHYNERGSKEHVEKIRSVLKHKQLRYNEIHEAIRNLSPEHILTTNYDHLLD